MEGFFPELIELVYLPKWIKGTGLLSFETQSLIRRDRTASLNLQ